MADLTTIFHHLQRQLFRAFTVELGPLSALDQKFCEVISLTDLGRLTRRYEWCSEGVRACGLRRRLAAKFRKAPGRCFNPQPGRAALHNKWKRSKNAFTDS